MKDAGMSTASYDGGTMARDGRCAWNMTYGPRLDEPKALDQRGDEGELTKGNTRTKAELQRHAAQWLELDGG